MLHKINLTMIRFDHLRSSAKFSVFLSNNMYFTMLLNKIYQCYIQLLGAQYLHIDTWPKVLRTKEKGIFMNTHRYANNTEMGNAKL